MNSLSGLLATYKSVHLNKTNIATHFIGIPLILWAAALFFATFQYQIFSISTNLMQILAVFIFSYYLFLDIKLGAIAIVLIAPIWLHAQTFQYSADVYWLTATVFFIGWIFQFFGHFFEKAKPAFFEDIKQLLIGPLFLVAEIVFFFNFFDELEEKVTKEAIESRNRINNKI